MRVACPHKEGWSTGTQGRAPCPREGRGGGRGLQAEGPQEPGLRSLLPTTWFQSSGLRQDSQRLLFEVPPKEELRSRASYAECFPFLILATNLKKKQSMGHTAAQWAAWVGLQLGLQDAPVGGQQLWGALPSRQD